MHGILCALALFTVSITLVAAQNGMKQQLLVNFKEVDRNSNAFITFDDEFYPFALTQFDYAELPEAAAYNTFVSSSSLRPCFLDSNYSIEMATEESP